MKPETIKAIFTNLLFVIGVILVVFGFSKGTLTAVRLLTFEKYPLNSYEETRCELDLYAPKTVGEPTDTLSKEEKETQTKKCKDALEHDRQVRKIDDVVISLSILAAGLVISFSFKRFIMK